MCRILCLISLLIATAGKVFSSQVDFDYTYRLPIGSAENVTNYIITNVAVVQVGVTGTNTANANDTFYATDPSFCSVTNMEQVYEIARSKLETNGFPFLLQRMDSTVADYSLYWILISFDEEPRGNSSLVIGYKSFNPLKVGGKWTIPDSALPANMDIQLPLFMTIGQGVQRCQIQVKDDAGKLSKKYDSDWNDSDQPFVDPRIGILRFPVVLSKGNTNGLVLLTLRNGTTNRYDLKTGYRIDLVNIVSPAPNRSGIHVVSHGQPGRAITFQTSMNLTNWTLYATAENPTGEITQDFPLVTIGNPVHIFRTFYSDGK